MNRYEFIELIVRIAHHCHKVFEVKRAPSSAKAVELVLECLYSKEGTMRTNKEFRKEFCYDQKVADALSKHENGLHKVFEKLKGESTALTLEACEDH